MNESQDPWPNSIINGTATVNLYVCIPLNHAYKIVVEDLMNAALKHGNTQAGKLARELMEIIKL